MAVEIDAPASLRRAAAVTLDAVGVNQGHVAIALVDEDEIRRLNREYRHRDVPTDVLSFPVDGAGENSVVPHEWGDVLICAEHTSDLDEAVVHGVLHLCGYDHEVDDGEMLRLQDRIMDSLR